MNVQRTVRSVDRALDALERVAGSPTPMTLGQLAETMRAPKSTALNIVRTLVRRGLLDLDAGTKTYRAGHQLAGFGADARASIERLSNVAKPHLEHLGQETGEFVYLSVLDGNEIRFVAKIESSRPIRYIAEVGTRRPLHCTAGGKMSLALQPDARVQEYIMEVGLQRYTSNTITSQSSLRRELGRIRRRRYAISNGEFLEDLMGIAVPVATPGGAPPSVSLVVAGPAFRMRKHVRRIVALMQQTAAAVAAEAAPSQESERSNR